jgi:hypothetical protein
MPDDALLAHVDHLVYATPDVDATVDALERLTGVRATPGGPHPGRGTRNGLLSLGGASYLEVLGPDEEQPAPAGPRWMGIDTLDAPRLVTWAARVDDFDRVAEQARALGLGPVAAGSRRRPDGVLLAWRFTDPRVVVADGVVPFLIDWGTSPHPSATSARGLSLAGLRAEHPDTGRVRAALARLGLPLPVEQGPAPALVAMLETPRGRVTLR